MSNDSACRDSLMQRLALLEAAEEEHALKSEAAKSARPDLLSNLEDAATKQVEDATAKEEGKSPEWIRLEQMLSNVCGGDDTTVVMEAVREVEFEIVCSAIERECLLSNDRGAVRRLFSGFHEQHGDSNNLLACLIAVDNRLLGVAALHHTLKYVHRSNIYGPHRQTYGDVARRAKQVKKSTMKSTRAENSNNPRRQPFSLDLLKPRKEAKRKAQDDEYRHKTPVYHPAVALERDSKRALEELQFGMDQIVAKRQDRGW